MERNQWIVSYAQESILTVLDIIVNQNIYVHIKTHSDNKGKPRQLKDGSNDVVDLPKQVLPVSDSTGTSLNPKTDSQEKEGSSDWKRKSSSKM